MQILVGIPFFNERVNLEKLIKKLSNLEYENNIEFVFFDDGSTDGSVEYILSNGLKVIKNLENTGYGDTVKRVCKYAEENKNKFFIIFPGDFQRSFNDLNRLLEVDEKHHLVITSKLRSNNMPTMRRLGNYFFSFLFMIMFFTRPIDVLSGFKRYQTSAFSSWIQELPSKYPFDLCLVYVALSKKLNIKKIQVDVNYENQTSKMTRSVPIEGLILLSTLIAFSIKFYFNKDKYN